MLCTVMLRSEVLDEEVARSMSAYAMRITPPSERRSSVYMTKFEVARIVGERARQIVNGTAVSLPSGASRDATEDAERCANPLSLMVDPVMIAKQDLLQRRIGMIVRRTWPDGTVESIPANELLVDAAMLDVQF